MRTENATHFAIAALADRQWGVVARRQLLAIGLGTDAIGRMLRSRRLRRLHHGVYAVGHRALRPEGYRLAAVLACGEGAVLSHSAAAAHLGLRPSAATRFDVIVPSSGHRRRPGLRVHRMPTLRAEEVTVHDRVPVTTVARTMLDLAATFPRRTVERALDQAEVLRVFDLGALHAVVEAHRGRPGAPLLGAVLEQHVVGETVSRSALEEAFLALCACYGIARPRVNTRVAGLEVDFHWPRRRLVIEVDGFAFHRTRAAFERDRERDAILAAAGIRVLRFSHRQVTLRPVEVAAALRSGRRW